MDTLGKRLLHVRTLAGLSLRDLEAASGISGPLISRLERDLGRRSSYGTIRSLAKALNVTPEWLEGGVGAMHPPVGGGSPSLDSMSVFEIGKRVFEQWVETKEPQHLDKLPAFFERSAQDAHRWSALTTSFDVTDQLIADFRAWRRGDWDSPEPAGVPYVRTRKA